jgi:alpha-beta hydrolase superfamily lysophospholipase
MRADHFAFKDADRVEIFVYRWLPDDPAGPKAVVQVAHGMAEHAGRYERLAESLTAAGYAVYAPDHRGHGRTARSEEELGFLAESGGFDRVVEDHRELALRIRTEAPGRPVFFFGHSMGATLAQVYLSRYGESLRGAVLSGTTARQGPLLYLGLAASRLEAMFRGSRERSPFMTALSFGAFNRPFRPNRTEFDWLSRDGAEVDKYVADPRCGFICTTSFFYDLLSGLRVAHARATYARVPKRLSIFVLSGDRDPVGGFGKSVRQTVDAYREAGCLDVTGKNYPGGRHEMLNETNRDEVVSDILSWLEARTGA